jgi:hypothetical protein
MILAILFAVLGYRKAEETGRGKGLWAFLMVVIFLGAQFLAGMIIGLFLAVGIAAFGWADTLFDRYSFLISVGGIAFSVVVCSGVLYLLGRRTEEGLTVPPSPDQYNIT